MKNCDKCGAKNATRAVFCSTCGARFRIADAETVRGAKVELEKRPFGDDAPSPFGRSEPASDPDEVEFVPDKIWRLLMRLLKAGISCCRFVWRFAAPGVRALGAIFRDTIVRAIAPSSSWDPTRPPNFLYWALVQFLVFKLPFALVGLVYAVLANTARRETEYDAAREMAERAKGWLLFDLAVGVVATAVKNVFFR